MTMSAIYQFDGDAPDFSEEVDAEPMVGNHPEIEIAYVSEYRISENNWEVSRYCDHAINIAWRVLDDLYRVANFFQSDITFNPHEFLKPVEQVAFEGFLKRAEHIVTEPYGVGFFLGEKELYHVSYIPLDEEKYSEDDEYLRSIIKEACRIYVMPKEVYPKIGELLKNNWEKVEQSNFGGRYCEFIFQEDHPIVLKLPSGSEIIFDKVVWRIITSFKQPKPEDASFQMITPEDIDRVRLIFPEFKDFLAIGTRPLN